jgi:hypothetical protein
MCACAFVFVTAVVSQLHGYYCTVPFSRRVPEQKSYSRRVESTSLFAYITSSISATPPSSSVQTSLQDGLVGVCLCVRTNQMPRKNERFEAHTLSYTRKHTPTQTQTHPNTHTHTNTQTHTQTHTHTHNHTHTHTHTHLGCLQ